MVDVGSRMHCVWALWMISRENSCLTPLELLKRPEFQLVLVLIAKKEACLSPLEALENLVDYSLGHIDQCQAVGILWQI